LAHLVIFDLIESSLDRISSIRFAVCIVARSIAIVLISRSVFRYMLASVILRLNIKKTFGAVFDSGHGRFRHKQQSFLAYSTISMHILILRSESKERVAMPAVRVNCFDESTISNQAVRIEAFSDFARLRWTNEDRIADAQPMQPLGFGE